MSCCSPIEARPEDTVGKCPCGATDVDKDGESTEKGCTYSPRCEKCGDCPCDMSC